ncbi:hypothetical protein AC1031_000128 [Aphanomyces cochlioides]|nr:hypothetical protein AC1031_000128 [Aphanomyces cochlioides]
MSKAKRPKKTKVKLADRTGLWCDNSVAKLFQLRYKSDLASRFNSKNNADKKVAYIMLAAELSLSMTKEFSVAQVQDKFQKLKTAWSSSNPTLPTPTGNLPKLPPPQHFDLMMEYWGSKFKREIGHSDRKIISCDSIKVEKTEIVIESDEDRPQKRKKKNQQAKTKNSSDALEADFNAIKDGLVFLGSSLAATNAPAEPKTGATMDDVLSAITKQNETLTKLLDHLVGGTTKESRQEC